MQVITQVFFDNRRYAFCREIPQGGYAVVGRLCGTSCTGELYLDGEILASHTRESEEHIKRTLMLALFYALKGAIGKQVPWGALTGVRPAKQVRIWMDEGESVAQIRDRLSRVYDCRDDKISLAIAVAQAEEKLVAQQNPGVGLYIGVPFCPSRCLYCSFVVAQKAGPDAHRRYLAALAEECDRISTQFSMENVNTIYIGGGTPTAFSEDDLEYLLKIVDPFVNNQEYTVEAGRPDSITRGKLALLKAHGVTRIAINPQTLNEATLERIGRTHSVGDFFYAYEMAREAGFDNINVDVIAGLPGEGPEDMKNTMDGLKKLAPEHITVHTLALKRASRLNEDRPAATADFYMLESMLDIARETCEELGLAPYYLYRQKHMAGNLENVGYCLPGMACLYNVAMMAETQTVLGAGAGAVTKVVKGTREGNREGTRIERRFNPKDVETYIGRCGSTGQKF